MSPSKCIIRIVMPVIALMLSFSAYAQFDSTGTNKLSGSSSRVTALGNSITAQAIASMPPPTPTPGYAGLNATLYIVSANQYLRVVGVPGTYYQYQYSWPYTSGWITRQVPGSGIDDFYVGMIASSCGVTPTWLLRDYYSGVYFASIFGPTGGC